MHFREGQASEKTETKQKCTLVKAKLPKKQTLSKNALSQKRNPLKTNTKTDSEGKVLNKSKHTSVSPILFLRVPVKSGQKKRKAKHN